MAANPKYYKKLSVLIKKLVKSLVPFDETSENFEACLEYCQSNIKHHNFLSVDSHKITQSFKDLGEKLQIHSQTHKADALQRSVNSFINTDISATLLSKSDSHYAILSLLLNLSSDPLKQNYTERIKNLQTLEEKQFDWKTYLLDGLDVPFPGELALEDLSDPGSDFEDETIAITSTLQTCSVKHTEIDDLSKLDITTDSPLRISYNKINSFKSEMVFPYWQSNESKKIFYEFTAPMRSAMTIGISEIPMSGLCLEEIYIVREIIWLLMGQTDLTVFTITEDKHKVCEEILLSHVTPDATKEILSSLCFYGDTVQKLLKFIFYCPEKLLTYQAFSASLLKYFKNLKSNLLCIERDVLKQEKTILVTDVLQLIKPTLCELSALNGLFEVSIDLDNKEPILAPLEKVTRLLGSIYHLFLDQWMVENEPSFSNFYNKLFSIWLDTVEPYISLIDKWISRGLLNDPYEEFILQRQVRCYDSLDNQFWLNAVALKGPISKSLPWLSPILKEIILAGKSMEVLESTGTLYKRLNVNSISNESFSLYSILLSNMNAYSATTIGSKVLSKRSDNLISPISKKLMHQSDTKYKPNSGDALLHLNFEKIFDKTQIGHVEKAEDTKQINPDVPFPVIFSRSLYPAITERCKFSNELLLNVILLEQHLKSHLDIFQKYHLMGWGDVMYDFTRSVFDKIAHGEYWRDLTSLKGSLQEAILDSNPIADANEVMVKLNQSNIGNSNQGEFINVTDIIELEYKVEWPINLIITPESQKIYNSVFRYLLKVKRALYSLESLHFKSIFKNLDNIEDNESDIDEEYDHENSLSNYEKAHRLSLLRAKVLRLVSHWHNFIMTNVILSEKQSFMQTLDQAKSLDDIINAHENFLNRLYALCLLQTNIKASKFVQGTLQKVLHLSVIIHAQWHRGIRDMSTSSLMKYEAQYEECSEFLSVILKNIVNRGAVPLLESLAYFYT